MKPFAIAMVSFAGLVLTGCAGVQRNPPIQVWPDMRMQARQEAQATSGLFVDGRASRRRPDGVVAHGHLWEDNVFNTGLEPGGNYTGKSPVAITAAVLAEGEWRFNTYCSPCHDRTGLGKGMVAQRATTFIPADLTQQRLVEAADGDLFNVITNGRRTMPPYGAQNRPAERWAIVAYVRVLQRAQHGLITEVPEAERSSLTFKPGLPPIVLPPIDGPAAAPDAASGKDTGKDKGGKGGAKQ